MYADIGDGIKPMPCGRVYGEKVQFEACKEIFLYIANRILDAAFFMRLANAAGGDGEAIVLAEIQINGIKDRILTQ